jgi:manganese oxidase
VDNLRKRATRLPSETRFAASPWLKRSLIALGVAACGIEPASAAITCARTLTANVVVLDQPLMFNRLGAQNVNGMVYALRRDVIDKTSGKPESAGGTLTNGNVALRPDKRPRPLVLRMAAGDCLTVNFQNLLANVSNPFDTGIPATTVDEQVADRFAGFHVQGMQLLTSINDDASMVGQNPGTAGSLVAPGGRATYKLFGEKEGAFIISSDGATFGSEGTQGNNANGLFGAINVEPKAALIHRSQITEEEMRLATTGTTSLGQPIINYEATYPNGTPWSTEGKSGLPIINVLCTTAVRGKCVANEIVHSDINAVISGPNADGTFPPSTYPLESVGKRNPTVPNRLEAFREYTVVFHDEVARAEAFPGFFVQDPVFRYVLEGVKDGFMINYGSGGIGSEIIANRLGVGPMHDCLDCAYEEFFLTSFTVGDPAMVVDIPANTGLENCLPSGANCAAVGPKALKAFYPEDPANIHHSYTNDFVKFRNLHNGKEQHVFHLHNHQWLFNANDDNGNYLDAQGIGPGQGYTYEINLGGSGNRNKTAGDAIFHCHFYPHFAQGMWEHWRNHDVFEAGTRLAVSGTSFHSTPFALKDGTPAAGARALPDGEIVAGTPIPALVPLPGKAMALMPGRVTVVPKVSNGVTVGSNAKVDRTDTSPALVTSGNPTGLKNPGYPFWIAGIEDTVGQRPPTPVLDMLSPAQASALQASGPLFANIDPNQAGGWDGGLPRHTLDGVKAGGTFISTVSRLDFSKELTKAKAVFFPETGTDLEQVAMAFHAVRNKPSFAVLPNGTTVAATFVSNGGKPAVGAPFHEPCIDDTGVRMNAGVVGTFFSGETLTGMSTRGSSPFTAQTPRIFKATNIQFDAVFNKVGYHYPQQRIITFWEDAVPTINKQRPPEPFVFRLNTFDCAVYHHSNLVPKDYELDDFQVRTPTDVIGQHIHLPKWDLTTTDGAGNGWNYEDGTLSPGAVRERIAAINAFNPTGAGNPPDSAGRAANTPLVAEPHPFFGQYNQPQWLGARTTMERWFADPVVNVQGIDRGLGIIFTHDHFGPSSHQQIGLYSTMLIEPAGSQWVHNETGVPMYTRADGGPTSWQVAILPPATGVGTTGVHPAYREFYFEFSDFQHAYEAGVYVGADQQGFPSGVAPGPDTFRNAINPPAREQANPLFPNLVVEVTGGIIPGCPVRPCPQAISVQDPGMLVVNYRNEPVGLRVFDPNALGPDGKPGTQAAGLAGDLAFALQSRIDRAIPFMNVQPAAGTNINGTIFPPPINFADVGAGDPFTPMMRTYSGDIVRVKMQAGAHEEEHNATLHGMKWLQQGSGFGKSQNSGWRNFQSAGISEQFTLSTPLFADFSQKPNTADYAYSMDAANDGWWSGMWGLLRNYSALRTDLFALPNNPKPVVPGNKTDFSGVCPKAAPVTKFDITAVLANNALPSVAGVTIIPADRSATQHVGGPLNANGGTLIYNPRGTVIPARTVVNDNGVTVTIGGHAGPLHDPTAILYVRTADLDLSGKLKPGVPVEPVVLRAAAGDCIQVTLRNMLPAVNPDLGSLTVLMGLVKRDRNDPEGSIPFDNNLIRASSNIGLHPQLVEFDVTDSDGANVGINPVQTAGSGQLAKYQWYAGDLSMIAGTRAALSTTTTTLSASTTDQINVAATPVEFGGANLTPADRMKQGAKGMVGALVVQPQGSSWVEDADSATAARKTRTAATVTAGTTTFRDFTVMLQKALTQRYADGAAVEALNGNPLVPEDSQDSTGMALNYKVEPLWFRFALPPNAPFGRAAGNGFGDVPNAHEAYSNNLAGVGGDPVTPVFTAAAGQQVRMHVNVPHGTTRGTTWDVHGHVWQRQPYVCPGSSFLTLAGNCTPDEIGSRALGINPTSMYLGAQESITPYSHHEFFLPSAGGGNGIVGDYLFRDHAGFGNTSGLWGILRVQ